MAFKLSSSTQSYKQSNSKHSEIYYIHETYSVVFSQIEKTAMKVINSDFPYNEVLADCESPSLNANQWDSQGPDIGYSRQQMPPF